MVVFRAAYNGRLSFLPLFAAHAHDCLLAAPPSFPPGAPGAGLLAAGVWRGLVTGDVRARCACGLTTKELAWRLGVKTATVNAWECDRSQPGAHRLNKLSGLLNVSLSWLLHGVGTAPVYPEEEQQVAVVEEQLAKLKLLHAETGQLIGSIQKRLDRMSTPSHY